MCYRKRPSEACILKEIVMLACCVDATKRIHGSNPIAEYLHDRDPPFGLKSFATNKGLTSPFG